MPLRAVVVVLAFCLVASACGGDDEDASPASTPSPGPGGAAAGTTGAPANDGGALGVRLSQGLPAEGPAAEPVEVVDGVALTAAEVGAVIDRLPEWVVDDGDRTEFVRPAETLPPPLVGATIDVAFPAEAEGAPEDRPAGPVEVLRFQPEGEVEIAPSLSVTFDQPMVPLATLAQLDARDVPVVITPELDGRWQWIGTRTLRFEYSTELVDRLPMATEYTVEVPAGTTSASGSELAEAVTWRFSTPAPSVLRFAGESPSLALEPVFVAVFDQVVDPGAVLATVSLSAGGERRELRLAEPDEVAADDAAASAVESALGGRWVAFTPATPLPLDSAVRVEVGPGTPSAEGPRTAETTQSFTGRTYGPLEVVEHGCAWSGPCEPLMPLRIELSNPLDLAVFDPALVTVSPEIPDMTVGAQYDAIVVEGITRGRTTYSVTLGAGITDIHGQTLGADTTVEVEVGPASPLLLGLRQDFVTLDPLAARPQFSVDTINHDALSVRAYGVDPVTDWEAFEDFLWHRETSRDVPRRWELVLDTEVAVDGPADELVETTIDLGAALPDGTGHLVVVVEPAVGFAAGEDLWWRNQPSVAWVQATTVGLDAFSDDDEVVVWATDLRSGAPLDGVRLELSGAGRRATTGVDGLATLGLPAESGGRGLVVASFEDQTAVLSGGWYASRSDEGSRWYVIDDRGIYRPGETVRVKGWARRVVLDGTVSLESWGGDRTVRYVVRDPQGNEIAEGSARTDRLDGFDFSFELPEGANLGTAWIDLVIEGTGARAEHWFAIEEFRRPEFEVSARTETPGPYLRTEPATVAVEAAYFAGGPLAAAAVEWVVTTDRATYSPPGWDEFAFGVWIPWWISSDHHRGSDPDCCWPGFEPSQVETFSGLTDGTGTHHLRMDFDGPEVDLPVTVRAEATVTDVNRQAWASGTSLLVHAAELYVGLRSERTFVRRGDPLDISTVVTDIDGDVVAGRPLVLTADRLAWRFAEGRWDEVVVDTQSCEVTTETEPVTCSFITPEGGRYRITAVVSDDVGRTNRTELTRWVSGGTARPSRGLVQEQADLIPDREEYQPGEAAEILVQSPFGPAEGLLTVRQAGIVHTERFTVEADTAIVEVPIADEYVPGITVQVDLVGAAPRTDDAGDPLAGAPPRPAFATASLALPVPPLTRSLTVTATPQDAVLEPGEDTRVEVAVSDPAGDPVAGAGLVVIVVDEAVLALTGYELADPLSVFYGTDSYWWVQSVYGRSSIVLADLGDPGRRVDGATGPGDGAAGLDAAFDEVAETGAFPAASPDEGTARSGDAPAPIEVRQDFDALAVFAPDVTTGVDGTAVVDVSLPDSLTRYRVMVVAVDGADRFGTAESNITARLPLMVRPSAPRFLNFGDTFELPVVVQNHTGAPMEVDVVVQSLDLTFTAGEGRRVSVGPDDRVEVRFAATADAVGTARVRVAVVGGESADAAIVSLPVYTPVTTEAFAAYGVLDSGGVAQPVVAPANVFPQFGGLEVNTSSTALQALTDAVLYLAEYPYASADAHASRILAIAALADVLGAFRAEGVPTADELVATMESDLQSLLALQRSDGGFPVWARFAPSEPYHSIQATHALVVARDAGFGVPGEQLRRALGYLSDIEEHFEEFYGDEIRTALGAYAVHVRHLAGDSDLTKATGLYAQATEYGLLDAIAWLWPMLTDPAVDSEIERLFRNRVTETAGAATFTADYGEDAYLILHSDRRTDAIILAALVSQRPGSDLIPKVVNGLIGNQTRGRWANVQENVFVLLAMKDYFDTFEAATPDFVARIWLGDLYAAEHVFAGREVERRESVVPMSELVAGGERDLIISKEGPGRLYYRLGLRYAPDDLDLEALDRGFVVQRVYEAVDDPSDVVLGDDGVWRIRAGAEVRVRLTLVADSHRTNVALVDPLPAGLEPSHPALAVTPDLPSDPAERQSSWRWWRWYEHQNLRDDRAEAFTRWLSAGTYEYTYVARATTPGRFVAPPTKAEDLYRPDVFGRAGTDIVVVS